jgi:hypothetical protein
MKWQRKTTSSDTIFCSLGVVGYCGTNVSTEPVRIATLQEFDVIDRFFTTSCNLNTGHILRFFPHLHEKGHKACVLRKMPEE